MPWESLAAVTVGSLATGIASYIVMRSQTNAQHHRAIADAFLGRKVNALSRLHESVLETNRYLILNVYPNETSSTTPSLSEIRRALELNKELESSINQAAIYMSADERDVFREINRRHVVQVYEQVIQKEQEEDIDVKEEAEGLSPHDHYYGDELAELDDSELRNKGLSILEEKINGPIEKILK